MKSTTLTKHAYLIQGVKNTSIKLNQAMQTIPEAKAEILPMIEKNNELIGILEKDTNTSINPMTQGQKICADMAFTMFDSKIEGLAKKYGHIQP